MSRGWAASVGVIALTALVMLSPEGAGAAQRHALPRGVYMSDGNAVWVSRDARRVTVGSFAADPRGRCYHDVGDIGIPVPARTKITRGSFAVRHIPRFAGNRLEVRASFSTDGRSLNGYSRFGVVENGRLKCDTGKNRFELRLAAPNTWNGTTSQGLPISVALDPPTRFSLNDLMNSGVVVRSVSVSLRMSCSNGTQITREYRNMPISYSGGISVFDPGFEISLGIGDWPERAGDLNMAADASLVGSGRGRLEAVARIADESPDGEIPAVDCETGELTVSGHLR